MKQEQSIYSLDIITDTLCGDDKQVDIVREVLKETLDIYQWYFQTATDQQYRDVKYGVDNAVTKTIKLLQDIGQNTLAEEVKEVLLSDNPEDGSMFFLTKNKILTRAKKYMKIKLLHSTNNLSISASTYNKKFAVLLGTAFTECCEKYPLDEAPAHYDSNWDPLSY